MFAAAISRTINQRRMPTWRRARPNLKKTLAAAAPKSGVMQWLYATFAQAEPAKSCDQTATAFGATSLACENERSAR
jgi:hypothetical protein